MNVDGPAHSARRFAKTVAEQVMGLGAGWLLSSRRHRQGVRVALAFHNVVPEAALAPGVDPAVHMPMSTFTRFIEFLREGLSVNFVPAEHLFDDALRGVAVAVTFDDAYRGAIQYAIPWLTSQDIPSTVFVAPALLGRATTWWDGMGDALTVVSERSQLPFREELLQPPWAGLGDRILERFPVDSSQRSQHYGIATLDEIREVAESSLVRVGCHTWSHAALPSLATRDDVESELSRSVAFLSESGLPFRRIHAFPYGRWSERELMVLDACGYEMAFRVDGGPIDTDRDDRLCLPRVNVSARLSHQGLLLRLAGLRP